MSACMSWSRASTRSFGSSATATDARAALAFAEAPCRVMDGRATIARVTASARALQAAKACSSTGRFRMNAVPASSSVLSAGPRARRVLGPVPASWCRLHHASYPWCSPPARAGLGLVRWSGGTVGSRQGAGSARVRNRRRRPARAETKRVIARASVASVADQLRCRSEPPRRPSRRLSTSRCRKPSGMPKPKVDTPKRDEREHQRWRPQMHTSRLTTWSRRWATRIGRRASVAGLRTPGQQAGYRSFKVGHLPDQVAQRLLDRTHLQGQHRQSARPIHGDAARALTRAPTREALLQVVQRRRVSGTGSAVPGSLTRQLSAAYPRCRAA